MNTRTHGARAASALALVALVATSLVVGVGAPPAAAAPGPEPLITFYVPLPEDAAMEALRSIDTATAPPAPGTVARTTITITAASAGGVVYYDQWENGYEAAINDPGVTAGAGRTLVWGDNDTTNGDVSTFCPRCGGVDVIPAGGVITLNNTRLPDGTGTQAFAPGPVPTPRVQANVFWDGRDKIAGTRGLTVANIIWGQADALASGAVAALDTNRWGVRYVVPVGQNTPNPTGGALTASPTEYTALSVMAGQPNTTVLIDGNADGDFIDAIDRNVLLGAGEYVFVDGGILQGAQVIADKPVQADVYTGDNNADYEVSFLELIPINGFNTDYVAPAASYEADQVMVVYLYNPAAAALNVTKTTSTGSTVISVPAGGTTFTLLNSPLGGAARFQAATPFLASAIMGAASASNSARYDWGYAPVPTSYLTPSLVVGWAPASQDLTDINASPVWITSTQATSVYVDYDGDPSTGASFLPNTGVCSSADRYDTTVSVPLLSATRITDTDGDMTGARITTCDLNVKIAAAYGEDPAQALDGSGNPTGQPAAQGAAAGFPGLDLGTAQFPAPGLLIGKVAALVVDVNGDGTVDPGDTVEWTASLADTSATALSNLVATDELPSGLAYVPGSTSIDTGSGPVVVPDNPVPPNATVFPLDESGFTIGNLAPGSSVDLVYRTVITDPPPSGAVSIENILCAEADQAAECGSGGTPVDQPAIISDRVWVDTDNDGIQDVGETTGVSGVTVNLYLDANGDGVPDGGVVQTTTTNASGLYSFTVDPTPNYVVEFVRPTGRYLSTADQGADEALDSDADRTTGRTATINPAPGEVVTYVDAGLIDAASIGDRVWLDSDNDGIQDAGETTGVSGVTVNLYLDTNGDGTPDGGVAATTTTNGSGSYQFSNLDPNVNYVVEFVAPGGSTYSPTDQGADDALDSDASVSTGRTGTIDPAPGQAITNVDAGLQPPVLAVTKTSSTGGADVFPGDPITYTITVQNIGAAPLTNVVVTDSLPAGLDWVSTSVSRPVTTSLGTWADDLETSGYSGSTGSSSWSGSWTEVGDDGVTTTGDLRNAADGGDRSLRIVDDADLDDAFTRVVGDLSTATSATLGFDFRCADLEADDDVVVEVRPNGSATYRTLATYSNCNSASYTAQSFSLLSGDRGTATEIRFRVSEAFTGFSADDFYIDNVVVSASGRTTPPYTPVAGANPTPGPLTTLTDLLPGETATITVSTNVQDPLAPGITTLTNTACADPDQTGPLCDDVQDQVGPAVISDLVWDDHDGDGVRDAGEPGRDGVTVELYDSTGTTLLQTVTTAGGGLYSFEVPAGSYTVRFVAPTDTSLTLQDEGGDDTADSDPDPSTGFTGVITVASGDVRTDVDAGLTGTGSIGDTVFWDRDDSGTFDAGEGLSGVDVTLVWFGPNGVAGGGDDVTYTTTTGANGFYQFASLPAGSFSVTVDTADLPAGVTTSSVDPDGGNDSTSAVTLAAGESNQLQDFGYQGSGIIGDTVFLDFDGDGTPDAGEGLAGVDVTLVWFGPNGVAGGGDDVTYTTTTGANGFYQFASLPAGSFSVTVDTADLPSGVTANTVDPDGGNDSTSAVTLATGQSNLLQDFGYRGTASIGDTIFWDRDGDSAFDVGEGVAGVDVTLVWAGPDGDLATAADNLTTTTTTGAGGAYLFSGLPPGTFSVTVDTADLPSGVTTNTVDPDGPSPTGDATSVVTGLAAGASDLDQDFGFVGTGTIGDTIFEDVDDDGAYDVGEGLSGIDVTVTWFGSDGQPGGGDDVTFTTTTGANGFYEVTGLPAGFFSVTVDTADLPAGVTINVVDPDGGNDSTSLVTLATGQSNVLQDFGYRRPNSPPSLGADLVARCANTPGAVTVLANDVDPDSDPITITAAGPTSAAGGTVTLVAGVVSYTPPANLSGVDVFTYTATDGYGGFSTTTVSVVLSGDCLIGNDRMFTFGLGGTSGPGPNPGQYDRLTSGSALRLTSQQLVIKLRNGFVPQVGDTFDIWTAPSMSGAFAQVYGQVMPNGVVLEVQVLPDRVRLVARQGLIVTTAADEVDTSPGDGVCLTATGLCSLRAAVQESNALAGTQAIVALARSSMGLSIGGKGEDAAATGDLDLTGDVVLVGQQGTVDANGVDRALEVRSGVLSADRLIVREGIPGEGQSGGALLVSSGSARLVDVDLTASSATNGGGAAATSGSLVLTRVRSTFNTASGSGGGLALAGSSTATLDTFTAQGNSASTSGGGVDLQGTATLTGRDVVARANTSPTGGGVQVASTATATLSRVTVWQNQAPSGSGGGIHNAGTLTLTDGRVLFSTATLGAGLYNQGTATVTRVTFDNNQGTGSGGGVANAGTLVVATSTFSANSSPIGAAIAQSNGSTSLTSVTITANSSVGGFALVPFGGTVSVTGSVIANQTFGSGCSTSTGVSSGGYNHASDASCGLTGTGDVQTGSSMLGALAANGGFAPTHKPATGSPVVNTGALSGCGTTDQRSFPRPRGGACEKGSVEL